MSIRDGVNFVTIPVGSWIIAEEVRIGPLILTWQALRFTGMDGSCAKLWHHLSPVPIPVRLWNELEELAPGVYRFAEQSQTKSI